jgi:hypothetical protein
MKGLRSVDIHAPEHQTYLHLREFVRTEAANDAPDAVIPAATAA